jgi:hypothetical protein
MLVRGLVGAPEWPAIRALRDEDGRKTWPINRYLTRRTPD